MKNLVVALSIVKDGNMLARHNPIDPDVIKNREKFLAANGITMEQTTRLNVNALVRDKQTNEHDWCRYIEVGASDKGAGMRDGNVVVADALITRDANHALFLPVADCISTVIYDPEKHVLMLSHLGRHSLVQSGGVKSVHYLVDQYGCHPNDLKVWLSPAPSKEMFPIWALDNKGMKEIIFEQLATAGIVFENIVDNPADSASDPNYFSYSQFMSGLQSEDGDVGMVAMMTE